MTDGDAPDPVGLKEDLGERISALESRVDQVSEKRTTKRLAIVDPLQRERLVAEIVDGTLELRIDLPPSGNGRRTALLCFATPGLDELCAGVGVQLWVDGDIVDEISWWADETPRAR